MMELRDNRRGNLSRDLRKIRDEYYGIPISRGRGIWYSLLPFGLMFIGGLAIGMKLRGRIYTTILDRSLCQL
jgi:hypothetical protein